MPFWNNAPPPPPPPQYGPAPGYTPGLVFPSGLPQGHPGEPSSGYPGGPSGGPPSGLPSGYSAVPPSGRAVYVNPMSMPVYGGPQPPRVIAVGELLKDALTDNGVISGIETTTVTTFRQ
ncbi:hypothetical protein CLU79DRAFT_717129 [Phycomyces nitens]|nr:hypothetical protein CLU79DRAFT_717129 [Phycomyces nitens]